MQKVLGRRSTYKPTCCLYILTMTFLQHSPLPGSESPAPNSPVEYLNGPTMVEYLKLCEINLRAEKVFHVELTGNCVEQDHVGSSSSHVQTDGHTG